MVTVIDREYQQRVLLELSPATNQPLRHDAAMHPFWQHFDDTPDKFVIATESYRKIALLVLQFLYLNGEELPAFYKETEGNIPRLLANLKRAFHNGNGESNDEVYIGELFGKRIYAQPTKGEKHIPGLTQHDEAYNKAAWLAKHQFENSAQADQLEVDMPTTERSSERTWYIGLDTLGYLHEELARGGQPEVLSKPSSWADFPQDWRDNPDAYRGFKERAIAERFLDGARLEGVTAGVMVDEQGQEVAIGYSSISTTIDHARLREVIDDFDPNAAAFGILQLLLDFDEVRSFDGDEEVMALTYPEKLTEQERIAGLFALAQIMGAPAWLVIELIASARQEKVTQSVGNEEVLIIPRQGAGDSESAVTA